jgi:tetratricopeptide (TPR) repeat protein
VARLFLSLLILGAQALAGKSGPSQNDAESYFKMGFDHFRLEAYPEAIAFFEKAIDRNPRYAEAYFHRGCSYSRLRRYQEAVNAFSKAIAINPGYFEAHNSRCWTYGKLSRWTEAVGICRQALAMRPSPEAFNNLGGAYGMLGL